MTDKYQVGMFLKIQGRHNCLPRIDSIAKINKQFFVTDGGRRFSLRYGREYGSSFTSNVDYAYVITEEEAMRIMAENSLYKAKFLLARLTTFIESNPSIDEFGMSEVLRRVEESTLKKKEHFESLQSKQGA